MRHLVLFFFSPIFFSSSAIAYPQVEMTACVINVSKSNPAPSYRQATDYCDCALTLLLEDGVALKEASYLCYLRYLPK